MPITKTKRGGIITSYSYRMYDVVAGPVLLAEQKTLTSWTDTKTGTNLPGFRKLISQGKDATTDFDGDIWKVEYKPGGYTVSFMESIPPRPGLTQKDYIFYGVPTGPSFGGLPSASQSAENTALMQLYKNIRKQHQVFSGLTFLGELRQAISMVKRPAATLRKGLDDYISTLKRRSKGIPKTGKGKLARKRILGDTWLEFSFGWTPLISDIEGGLQTIAQMQLLEEGIDVRRQRVTGFGVEPSTTQTTTYAVNEAFGAFNKIRLRLTQREESYSSVRYKARLEYKTYIPQDKARLLLQKSGFTLTEFIPTAWELLPWSFLVDYFTNVGDLLEAFTTPLENVYSITKTSRQSVSKLYSRAIDRPNILSPATLVSLTENGDGSGYWKSNYTRVSRRKVTPATLPLPRLRLENPFGSNAVKRSLNMASLIATSRSLKPFF